MTNNAVKKIVKTISKNQESDSFVITHYFVHTNKIQHNKRIVLLSDLHACQYGEKNEAILDACRNIQPDIICLTGDIASAENQDTGTATDVIKQLSAVFPTYYAFRNHETAMRKRPLLFKQFEKELEKTNVHCLSNESAFEQDFHVIGIELPIDNYTIRNSLTAEMMRRHINECEKNIVSGAKPSTPYRVMLIHTPEYANLYFQYADLILCGHFHGGEVKVFNKPLVNPHHGLFPKYGYGMHQKNGNTLIVSGEIGDPVHFRINNPPELVVVHLTAN